MPEIRAIQGFTRFSPQLNLTWVNPHQQACEYTNEYIFRFYIACMLTRYQWKEDHYGPNGY